MTLEAEPFANHNEHAWRLLNYAETRLYTRQQALYIAQSFLVGAYATLVSRWHDNLDVPRYPLLVLLVLVLGLSSSVLLGWRVHFLSAGLDFVVANYLRRDDSLNAYEKAIVGPLDRAIKIGSYSTVVPALFSWFWAGALVFWSLAFWAVK